MYDKEINKLAQRLQKLKNQIIDFLKTFFHLGLSFKTKNV